MGMNGVIEGTYSSIRMYQCGMRVKNEVSVKNIITIAFYALLICCTPFTGVIG